MQYYDWKLSSCFDSRCDNGNVVVTISDTEYLCQSKDQKIYFGQVYVQCPDPVEFCGLLEQECDEDCNANGVCLLNKTCRCDVFYEGPTCAQKSTDCASNDPSQCYNILSSFSSINAIFNLLFLAWIMWLINIIMKSF